MVSKIQKTILVVDDEKDVIRAICEDLRGCGWRLIATTKPHQALTILKQDGSINLLITDLFMPGMDGAKLLTEGRKVCPNLRTILLTGLASEQECLKWRKRGEIVLWKPWPEEELVKVVAKTLNCEQGEGERRSNVTYDLE